MDDRTWQSMSSIDPMAIQKARELAHNAVQWLARLANSYIPPEPEYRHLLLAWHPHRRALVTRSFADGLSVELRLPDLHMQFAGNGKLEPHILDIEDHTPAEVEAWILVELLHRNMDRSRFSKDLPYQLPGLLTGDSTDYSPASCMPALLALTDWLHHAEAILAKLAPENASLHCWPETFEVGRLLPMEAGQTEGRTMLRAGVSAGDALCPEPFFFVRPDAAGPRGQPHPGTLLPMSRIVGEAIPTDGIVEFLSAGIAANRNRQRL